MAMTAPTHDNGPIGDCSDPVALDMWHPIAGLDEIAAGHATNATLLGVHLDVGPDATVTVAEPASPGTTDHTSDRLPTLEAYGYLWACVGTPPEELFAIDEYDEPDRRNVSAGAVGVMTSAPRAVENFLDMGHFPFVHGGILGTEPFTEVEPYETHLDERGELYATNCRFYQPQAAATATSGQMVDYVYRVPQPYCVMLYKSCPADPDRMDVIALFIQPVGEEFIRGHMMLSLIDDENTDARIKAFQQQIFGQDKPILENQRPRRLPLSPSAETPIRADASSIAYRRWLTDIGLSYGVIR